MEAPRRAKALTVARPTPAEAPVTTTTSADFMMSPGENRRLHCANPFDYFAGNKRGQSKE
jgi:hypothetical protein